MEACVALLSWQWAEGWSSSSSSSVRVKLPGSVLWGWICRFQSNTRPRTCVCVCGCVFDMRGKNCVKDGECLCECVHYFQAYRENIGTFSLRYSEGKQIGWSSLYTADRHADTNTHKHKLTGLQRVITLPCFCLFLLLCMCACIFPMPSIQPQSFL